MNVFNFYTNNYYIELEKGIFEFNFFPNDDSISESLIILNILSLGSKNDIIKLTNSIKESKSHLYIENIFLSVLIHFRKYNNNIHLFFNLLFSDNINIRMLLDNFIRVYINNEIKREYRRENRLNKKTNKPYSFKNITKNNLYYSKKKIKEKKELFLYKEQNNIYTYYISNYQNIYITRIKDVLKVLNKHIKKNNELFNEIKSIKLSRKKINDNFIYTPFISFIVNNKLNI